MQGGRRRRWRGALIGFAIVAGVTLWGTSAASGQAPAATPAVASVHLQAFDRAWTIVYEQHFDTTFNGVDWVALRDELRPRAVAATTRDEVRSVIRELLARLGQSHFALIPEEALDEEDDPTTGRSSEQIGDVGMDVRLIDNRVVVTQVEPDAPAARAGIRPGWVVTAVGDRQVADLVERVRERDGIGPDTFRVWSAVLGRLVGDPASEVDVTLLDDSDRPVSLTLTRRREPSEPVRFGNLPTFFSRFGGRRLRSSDGDDVSVIWFNFWMVPLIRQVDSALFASRDRDGVVIDLRGNRGGVGAMVIGVAGHFFTDRTQLGTFVTRTARLEIRANPRRVTPTGTRVAPYDGPVAVVVDETSASASEVFAGGMQSVGRARVFGSTTAGAVLPAVAQRLPNDDVLYAAFAEFTTASGMVLEGRGVLPDEEVRPTRDDLLAGRDVVLEAALQWIHRQRAAQQ